MTETTVKRCPSCAMPIQDDADRMCSSCGADLTQPPAEPDRMYVPPDKCEAGSDLKTPEPMPAESSSAGSPVSAAWDAAKKSIGQAIGLTDDKPESRIGKPAAHVAAPAAEPPRPVQAVSDCEELQVEYNFSRVFMDGLHVPFQFRITPKQDKLANLFIEIRRDGNPVAREEPDEILCAHRRLDIHMAYRPPPGLQGIISFEIYIGYDNKKTRQVFKARPTHNIFRGFEKVGSVINSLKIEINNNLKAEGAADNVIKQHMDGLEALRPKEDNPVTELAAIDIPACWNNLNLHLCKQVALEDTDGDGIPAQPAGAHMARLTLRCGTHTVQLLSGETVHIGKNRKCDVVARSVERREQKSRDAAISRYHCRIERRSGRSMVIDLGYYPDEDTEKPSTCGTFLDGQRLPPGGRSALPTDRAFTLSLSGSDKDPSAYVFEGYQQTRDTARQTPFQHLKDKPDHESFSLVLRSSHAPITHVIVWEAIACRDLKWDNAEAWICRLQNGFLLVDGKRKEWLTHGKTLYMGGQIVDVTRYESWREQRIQ